MALPLSGSKPAVLEPKLFVAVRGSNLPNPVDGPLGMEWGAQWAWIPYTANGVLITPANPKVGYPTDEAGEIEQFNAGTESVTWNFQARTPTSQLLQWLGGFKRTAHAARKQKQTLTITASATAAGTVTVTLEDVATNVSIALSDTPTQVADKIVAAFASNTVYAATKGDTSAKVVFTQITAHAFTGTTAASYNAGGTGATATFATLDPDFQKFRKPVIRFNLDPKVNNEFMCGIEGKFGDHSLEEVGGLVRSFAYRAQNTENPQVAARKSGADAPIQPVANLRCNPEVLLDSQWKPSGMPAVDEYGRWDMFFI